MYPGVPLLSTLVNCTLTNIFFLKVALNALFKRNLESIFLPPSSGRGRGSHQWDLTRQDCFE